MIHKATLSDARGLGRLAAALWEHHSIEDMTAEMVGFLHNPHCALFLAEIHGEAIGFAQCQLRHDYVEGTESSPVGYLEGIYVSPEHRRGGIARELLTACEIWAKEMGCREFASDCDLTNTESLAFHLRLGFTEANRIICFTKAL